MAGFGNKLKNLWSVPEELEENEHSNRRSRSDDFTNERRNRNDSGSELSYRSRYSDDLQEDYYYDTPETSSSGLDTYTNYSNEDYLELRCNILIKSEYLEISVFLCSLGYLFGNESISKILTEGKFYIEKE